MNNLEILQGWFQSNCNGDWEHNFGVRIETLDNPGWHIVVDLEDTQIENINIEESVKISDTDWHEIKTSDMQLLLSGDSSKLVYLIDRISQILAGTMRS